MKRILTSATLALAIGLTASVEGAVTGQWDFNSSNLTATAGIDLAYFGDTEAVTSFTTATIGGSTAVVMNFPAATATQGYIMTHGIAPNGGGSYVNQYTLIMDIMFPTASSDTFRGLFQTSTANANDGDLFVNGGNGIGISGAYSGLILADTWHRVAFVFDLTLPSQTLRKYIDGLEVGTQNLTGLDGRWSLDPDALLFTDEDGETAAGFVNSIQIHDVPLSASDIFALGKPTAAGIPPTIPVLNDLIITVTPESRENVAGMTGNHFTASVIGTGTITYQWQRNGTAMPGKTDLALRFENLQLSDAGSYTLVADNGLQKATSSPPAVLTVTAPKPTVVTGQWDFNQGDLRATFGQPMQFFNATVQTDTQFGTTANLGISDLGGQQVNVMMCYPSTTGVSGWGGYVVPHGISPNGGGAYVNQYTVILDLLYPNWTSGFYRGMWQTDITNTNDADLFINGNNGLGISSTYQGNLTLDEWHRVVFAFDLTKRELGKYIDGTNVMTQALGTSPLGPNDAQYLSATDGIVDMRWSLGSTVLLLADGDDGEVQPVYVSSVQMRSGRMTDAEVAALGGPSAGKIPGALKATRSGSNIIIEWTGTVLESATSLAGPWSAVAGAAHPYTITAPSGSQFYRVQK